MRILLVWLFSLSMFGQLVPRVPWQELRTYLGLTDDQMAKLLSNQEEFSRWRQARQQRSDQVQMEIWQETAANPLDPNALGLRYAEVEAIRREIAERQTKLIQDNQAILTAAQQLKYQALEEAVKLRPVIDEARWVSLMPNPCPSNRLGVAGDFGGACNNGIIITDPVIPPPQRP